MLPQIVLDSCLFLNQKACLSHKAFTMSSQENTPEVAIIMGSNSDWPTMRLAVEITPDAMYDFAKNAEDRGVKIIIAGAGGAAHLPGMVAALTTLPVLGCPIKSSALSGKDSLLSIVQMPKGIPVPTFAIGNAGAANAALSAISILALNDKKLSQQLKDYRAGLIKQVEAMDLPDMPSL